MTAAEGIRRDSAVERIGPMVDGCRPSRRNSTYILTKGYN